MILLLLPLLLSVNMTSALAAYSPSPSPSPDIDCTAVIYGMMDCVDYVSPDSTDPAPSKSCCAAIEAVVELDPSCLCEAVDASAAMNIPLNMTRILDLPATCHISVPDLHNCTGDISPAAAPAPASEPVTSSPVASPPVTSSPGAAPMAADDGMGLAPADSAASLLLGCHVTAFVAALIFHL